MTSQRTSLLRRVFAVLRTRRAWAVLAAATAMVLAATLVTQPWSHRGGQATLAQLPTAADAGVPLDSAVSSAPVTPSPSAADTSSAPQTGGGGDGLGPAAPGSVSVPHNPGQHSWSGVSNGMSIHASISPETPHAGSPVTFTVHVSGPEKDCCAVYVVFGDGGVYPSQTDCPLPTTGGSATVSYTHVYNKPGPHHLLIQAISGNCNDNGVIYATLDVGDGTSTAQGPQLPVVKFDNAGASGTYSQTVALWGEARDEDGHLTKLVVTFGDGTSHTFDADPNPCRPTTDGWPGPSHADLPGEPSPYRHTYSHPGTYTLRLTAYSAGCDGSDVQTGTATMSWLVGGPSSAPPSEPPSSSPTPSPSPTDTPSPTP